MSQLVLMPPVTFYGRETLEMGGVREGGDRDEKGFGDGVVLVKKEAEGERKHWEQGF